MIKVVNDNSSLDESQDRESNPLDDEDLGIRYKDLKVDKSREGYRMDHQESYVEIISQLLNSPVSDIKFGYLRDEGNFSPSDYILGLGKVISREVIDDKESGYRDIFRLIQIGDEEVVLRSIRMDTVGGGSSSYIYRKK